MTAESPEPRHPVLPGQEAPGPQDTGRQDTGRQGTGRPGTGRQGTGPQDTGPQESERQIVLALGSNLGDRLANLQAGIDALAAEPRLRITAVSGVFRTSPVGGPDQPDYLNAVLLAVSALPGRSILDRCQAAERAAHRVRTMRWGPRTLDIDIIACGQEMSEDPALTLPHPRAHERAFVLVPWHEVDPGASLPGAGPVADLLARTGTSGVERLAGAALTIRTAEPDNQG